MGAVSQSSFNLIQLITASKLVLGQHQNNKCWLLSYLELRRSESIFIIDLHH